MPQSPKLLDQVRSAIRIRPFGSCHEVGHDNPRRESMPATLCWLTFAISVLIISTKRLLRPRPNIQAMQALAAKRSGKCLSLRYVNGHSK